MGKSLGSFKGEGVVATPLPYPTHKPSETYTAIDDTDGE
jgi:hypothetical protein